jgi:uncharacterized protein YggE
MYKRAALTLFLLSLAPAAVFGQAASSDRTITVTATRNTNLAPDQAQFTVTVLSSTDSTRDDVLLALQGSGITVANFNSVYTVTRPDASGRSSVNLLQWTFVVTAPLSNLNATVVQLTALQRTIAQKNNGMSLSFAITGTQLSAQALAGQTCAASDLIADAKAQAQKMATAAGLAVGAIVAVSAASVVTPPADTLFASAMYQPVCSLTVKFAVTGF